LPDLVRLRLAADFLQVHEFRQRSMLKDVMTSTDAHQTKPEALHKIANVAKANVLKVAIEEAA
jgi:hypothetical protein